MQDSAIKIKETNKKKVAKYVQRLLQKQFGDIKISITYQESVRA